MAQYPSLPLFTDAFLADTIHLNAQETGAYLLLLMAAWRAPDCSLPDDDKVLARVARMDGRGWTRIKDNIMAFWVKSDCNKWVQKRLLDERRFADEQRSKNARAGRASALKRKERGSTGVATQAQPKSNPHTHTHIIDNKLSIPPIVPLERENEIKFTEFWQCWQPNDMDKGSIQNAQKMFNLALKETDHDTLITKSREYCALCRSTGQRTCHASTWLNPKGRAGYKDEYGPVPSSQKQSGSQPESVVRAAARAAAVRFGQQSAVRPSGSLALHADEA